MVRKILPKYRKPPVVEVVCCVYFQDLVGLHAPHLGTLWDAVRSKYKRTQSVPAAPPIAAEGVGISPISLSIQVEPEHLGRTWFMSTDDVSLIQVQRDRLVFNWRKRNDKISYPSYDVVIKEFKDIFRKFIKFVKSENIGTPSITGLELSYVNVLEFGREIGSIRELDTVFPFINYRSIRNDIFHSLENIHCFSQFDLGDDRGHLSMRLNTGQRRADGDPVLRLDFTARKIAVDIPTRALWPWFDLAHKAIVTGFSDLTSPDIQRNVWERTQ